MAFAGRGSRQQGTFQWKSRPAQTLEPPALLGRDGKPAGLVEARGVVGFSETLDADLAGEAGRDVLHMLCDAYRMAEGCHLETVMAAVAALAGEYALRAGMELTCGEPNWAVAAAGKVGDPFLFGSRAGATSLWTFACVGAMQLGAAPSDLPKPTDVGARVEALLRADGFPATLCPGVPAANQPLEWPANACPRHRRAVVAVMARHGIFDAEETAYALGWAITCLFNWGAGAISADGITPAMLARLAMEVMTATSRMPPLEAEVRF